MRCAIVLALFLTTADVATQGVQPSTSPVDSRGATNLVSGRVVNSAGEPVEGAVVTLLKDHSQDSQGVAELAAKSQPAVTTNARGEFQFTSLAPGSYSLVAHPRDQTVRNPLGSGRVLYETTYFPAAATPNEAQAVDVGPSGRVTANITLISIPLFTISGFVANGPGDPFRRGVVRLTPASRPSDLVRGQPLDDDGWFMVRNVPAGEYCVRVIEGVWPPPGDDTAKVSAARVTVRDRNVTNLQVDPLVMVKVTGRVLVDAATKNRLLVAPLEIRASLDGSTCYPSVPAQVRVRNDLTFEFQTWPGSGRIVLSQGQFGKLPASIRVNGKEMTNDPFDFRPGRSISGLEIEVAPSR